MTNGVQLGSFGERSNSHMILSDEVNIFDFQSKGGHHSGHVASLLSPSLTRLPRRRAHPSVCNYYNDIFLFGQSRSK
jgi:hypothetical protein